MMHTYMYDTLLRIAISVICFYHFCPSSISSYSHVSSPSEYVSSIFIPPSFPAQHSLHPPSQVADSGRKIRPRPPFSLAIDFRPLQRGNSFIPAISVALLQVLYHSCRGAPDYSTDTVSDFHAEAHRQLQVKDLPKVPT